MIQVLKKAFTLIEMMIAVSLFSMVVLFLTSTLESQRVNYVILKNKTDYEGEFTKFITLLKNDIQQSSSLKIIKGDDDISLELRTTSSIYQISAPFVKWFVNPTNKTFIRSESSINLLPPYNTEELSRVHLDKATKAVQWFKAYQSKDATSLFLSLKADNRVLLLEFLSPQYKK